ncbi:hypothetical protein HF319_15155, partial [Xanthomonas sp. Kuri4-1]
MVACLKSLGTLAVAAAALGAAASAQARPNCDACVPDYQACVASGAADCDTRYAVCLAWCPAAVTARPQIVPQPGYSPVAAPCAPVSPALA